MPTIKQSNNRVLVAWGESFLNFNMPYIVKLANEKQVDLWPLLLEVDAIETPVERISKMNEIFKNLLEKGAESKTMDCPMCETVLTWTELKAKEGDGKQESTHIYVCPECPFVGFEYLNKTDTERVMNYLERPRGE